MDFERCVAIVIEREGSDKITNDPKDPGGLTKWGISKRSYPNVDIAALTREGAERIYKKDYWDKMKLDDMPECIRLPLFDAAVNQGCFAALKMLQRSLGIQADGVIGPQTMGAIRALDKNELCANFMAERALAYTRMSGFERFGKGWIRRLFHVTLET